MPPVVRRPPAARGSSWIDAIALEAIDTELSIPTAFRVKDGNVRSDDASLADYLMEVRFGSIPVVRYLPWPEDVLQEAKSVTMTTSSYIDVNRGASRSTKTRSRRSG